MSTLTITPAPGDGPAASSSSAAAAAAATSPASSPEPTSETYTASDAVSILWEATACIPRVQPAHGNGDKATPYQLAAPEEWLWVAQHRKGTDTYLQIGGREIFWRGEDQYIIDNGKVGSVPTLKELAYKAVGKTSPDPRSPHPAAAYIGTSDPDSRFGSDKGPTYPDMYLQLEKDVEGLESPGKAAAVAEQVRRLLLGQQSMTVQFSKALPALTATWFLAEVSRNPSCLGSGLMLLDMIESHKEYRSPTGQPYYYTWDKVLWTPEVFHAEESYFEHLRSNIRTAVTGLDPEADRVADVYRRRKEAEKDAAADPILVEKTALTRDQRGGDHPMAHLGSVAQSKVSGNQKPTQQKLTTPVRQKEALLVNRWLAAKVHESGQYQATLSESLLPAAPDKSDMGVKVFGKMGRKAAEKFEADRPAANAVIKPVVMDRLTTFAPRLR